MEYQQYLDKCKRFYKQRNQFSLNHDIVHIEKMFQIFNQYEKQFDKEFEQYSKVNDYNKKILGYAIAYHDSYYIPYFNSNKHISAQIADYDLYTELDNVERSIVCDLIESTNYNFPFSSNPSPNKLILHDLDWYCFVDYKELFKNEIIMRTENVMFSGKFSDEDFIQNQIHIYKKLVNKKIFKTQTFSIYNNNAKENIKKRINQLNKLGNF